MDEFLEDLSNMCVSNKSNIPEQEQTVSPYTPLSNTQLDNSDQDTGPVSPYSKTKHFRTNTV